MPVYNQVSPLDSPLVKPMEAVSDGIDGYTSSTTDYFRGVLGDDHSDIDLYNGFGNFEGYTGKTLIDAHDTFIRSLKTSGIWGKTYDLVLFFGHKERKNISLFHPLEGTMFNTSPLLGRHIDAFQGANNTRPTLSKSSPVQLQRQRPNGTSYSFLGGAGNITGDDNKQTELRSRHRLPSSMTNGICMSAYIWNQGSYDNGSGSTDAEYGFSGAFMGAALGTTKKLSFGGSNTVYSIRVGGNTTISINVDDALTGVALHTLNLQSDNSYKIYKNGVEKYSGTNGDNSNLPVNSQMNHFWNGTTDTPWSGFISLTHYSEALTAQQVTALNSAVSTLVGAFTS